MEWESRPEADEYAPFYSGYVRRVPDRNILNHLAQQGDDILRFYSEMKEEILGFRYAPGKWTPREVFGHLCDTERVMSYRALCVARGDTTSLPGFDERLYVAGAAFDDRSLGSLLAEFGSVRSATLSLLASFSPATWLARGTANGAVVSTRALAWIIAGHADHHLAILRERYLEGEG